MNQSENSLEHVILKFKIFFQIQVKITKNVYLIFSKQLKILIRQSTITTIYLDISYEVKRASRLKLYLFLSLSSLNNYLLQTSCNL
jgi:hypothetical protein